MWRFSKGLLLTVLVTAILSFLILSYAYRQQRSSEILTGVIAGLTIILGMLTAELLRTSREQVEVTRSRHLELISVIDTFLYNFEEAMQNPYSKEQSHHLEEFNQIHSALLSLIQTTRWPQPNAGKIRDAALILYAKLTALNRDAWENGHIWSLEKRLTLALEAFLIGRLIWMRTAEEVVDFEVEVDKYRESPKNDGVPFGLTNSVPNP